MQFLSGDLAGGPAPLRPPWALDERLFVERCTRCGECSAACPGGLIVPGRGGYPRIEFSAGGCDFCGACRTACRSGALNTAGDTAPPWNLKAFVGEECLALKGVVCRACGEACDTRAIRFRLEVGGLARPLVDGEACTGCGGCLARCPVDAVNLRRETARSRAA